MLRVPILPGFRFFSCLFLIACLLSGTSGFAATHAKAKRHRGPDYANRADVERFVSEMVERHGFVHAELKSLFRKVNFQPSIVKAISPPAKPGVRSWQRYRALFVNPQRIEAGQSFLARHQAILARAEAEFGVPSEIIAAIIGVETVYGRNMGNYRVIDALSTLAFDYPPRAEYFRAELEQYLLYAREAGVDVFDLRGSYAGAFGIPQFMPGSFRRYAVDYDGNSQPDLVGSPADAIGSVANFLRAHGWRTSSPIAFPVSLEGEDFRKLVDGSVKPKDTVAQLGAAGVTLQAPPEALGKETLCVLVELETPGQPSEYRAALENFYVITRYNRSSFYAAAVMDLASALRQ